MVGGGAPGDEIAENLREWLDRLVSALPGIVRKLAGATAFSISVGANVAVTVDLVLPRAVQPKIAYARWLLRGLRVAWMAGQAWPAGQAATAAAVSGLHARHSGAPAVPRSCARAACRIELH
jgi:hypothetical protein